MKVCLSGYIRNSKNDAEELSKEASNLLTEHQQLLNKFDCDELLSEEDRDYRLEEIACLKRRIHGCINDLNNFIFRVYKFKDNPELLKEFLDSAEVFFCLKTTPLEEETENTVVILVE